MMYRCLVIDRRSMAIPVIMTHKENPLPGDQQGVMSYGVDDGARTHDHWNHNPGLYQLSYTHH
jgi:hypothetical protein